MNPNLLKALRAAGYTVGDNGYGAPSSVSLRQDRQCEVDAMTAITDRAERANRNLSADERRDFDARELRFKALSDLIRDVEAHEQSEIGSALSLRGGRGPEQRRGRNVALTRSQSMAEHVRSRSGRGDDGLSDFLGDSEGEGLSFGRIVRGMATGDWAGSERERRALWESNPSSAGVLVPAPMASQIIDLARNQARVMQAGAITVPMESATLKIARQTGDPSLAWHAEGDTIGESNLSFDSVTLRAHTLPCLVKFSLEMLEDVDNLEGIVEAAVSKAMANELDRVGLKGSGTDPEPKGIRNQTGVTLISATDTGAATWDTLVNGVAAVKGNNFDPNAQIISVNTEKIVGTQRESGTTGAYLAAPPYLDGVSRYATKQVADTEVYTGQWNQLLVGMRTNFAIRPLNELYADTGEYGVLCYLRADVAVAHGGAFAVHTAVGTV